jgi:hypothetical protein
VLDATCDGASLGSVISIAVSPEHDQDRNAMLVSLTSIGGNTTEGLGTIKIRSVKVGIPVVFPPIEEISVQQLRYDGYWDEVRERSSVVTEDRHEWTTRFPDPLGLLPGKALVLRLRCRHEETPIWDRGGNATITAVCSYSESLLKVSKCQLADAFGQLQETRSLTIQSEQTVTLVSKPHLGGHAFLRTHTVTRRLDDRLNFRPNRGFAQNLADRLADARILVRRVLESQSTSYEGRATPFECSLYGRLERSMSSPDIHIRIQSERQPPVEITVSGKVRGDEERAILEEVANEIADLAYELATSEARPTAHEVSSDPSDEGAAAERTQLAQIEEKLDHIIALVEHVIEREGSRR